MNNVVLQSVLDDEHRKLARQLDRIGLMYRSFVRVKSIRSMIAKDNSKRNKYTKANVQMTDCLGIRVTTYYPDDVRVVERVVESMYNIESRHQVVNDKNTFGPAPNNIVVYIEGSNKDIIEEQKRVSSLHFSSCIAATIEIQIRTVGSELWHEIEHKLRYKGDSNAFDTATERDLNRVLAALEQSEIALQHIASDLAHRSYKAGALFSMCAYLFRMDGLVDDLDDSNVFARFLRNNLEVRKKLLSVDRTEVMLFIQQCSISFDLKASYVASIALMFSGVRIEVSDHHSKALSLLLHEDYHNLLDLLDVK